MLKIIVEGNTALENAIALAIIHGVGCFPTNQIEELKIVPKYPADQPDFEVDVQFSGADSEGHKSKKGISVEWTSTDETAVSVMASPTAEQPYKATVHVGGPGDDQDGQASLEVRFKNKAGEVIGFGSLPIVVTAGDATAVTEIAITGAPEGIPPDTPPEE